MTDNGANGRQREILIFEANGRQREILIFYLDEVCASFILVLLVQIVRTKKPEKPRLTSKQNEAQIYVGTVQGPSRAVP
jgi:hypothetical protein